MRISLLTLPVLAGLTGAAPSPVDVSQQTTFGVDQVSPKVNVTLYVMSRCPDARTCESIFDSVLKEDKIVDKVDLSLQFIAKPNKTDPLGATCMHGPSECLGNAHELCLQHHLSLNEWYPVLSCLNYQTPFPGHIGDVKLTRQCVEAAKIDWWKSGVGQCIQGHKAIKDDGKKATAKGKIGKKALKLLKRNVRETAERGVGSSCTIEIGDRGRCLVDGGVWKGCDNGHTPKDFARIIQEEWEAIQSQSTN